jgi:hypothetical protein
VTRCGAVAGAQAAVPWEVAQGIRQRVAALPAAAREVLGAAAVVGRVAARRSATMHTPDSPRSKCSWRWTSPAVPACLWMKGLRIPSPTTLSARWWRPTWGPPGG